MRKWLEKRLKEVATRGEGKAELARHLGIEPSAVTALIQGRRKIQDDEFEPLAQLLGWSVEQVHAADRSHKNAKNKLSPQSDGAVNDSSTMPEEAGVSAERGSGEGFTPEGLSDMELTKSLIKRMLKKYPLQIAAHMAVDIIDELEADAQKGHRVNPPKGA